MNNLIIKMPKSLFNKSKSFTVNISGQLSQELNYTHNEAGFNLAPGNYRVEVVKDNIIKTEQVTVSNDQLVSLSTIPALSPETTYKIRALFALLTAIVMIMIMNKVSVPLLFIPLLMLWPAKGKTHGFIIKTA